MSNFVHQIKQGEINHSTEVVHAGSSIIGIKYKDGIIIASDTNISRSNQIIFRTVTERVQQVTPRVIIGYSGDISDYQESSRQLNELILSDSLQGPSYLGPKELANFLSSVHYHKRSKMDPFLNSLVLGGYEWNDELNLYKIDSFGTLLKDNYFLTAYSHYFCNAIFEEDYGNDYTKISKEKAIEILKKCFNILFYRIKCSGDVIVYKTIEKRGEEIICEENKFTLKTEFNLDSYKISSNETLYLTS